MARNSSGFFNGIWSDMLIETTYMKFGSSPAGLVGVTLNPKSVLRWAYSFHKLSTMIKDLKEINEGQFEVVRLQESIRRSTAGE